MQSKQTLHLIFLEALTKAGISYFDVASVTEIALLRSIQPNAHLLYDNPIKSRREISQAYQNYQVHSFAIDDARELQKIYDVVGINSDIEISIRFQVDSSTAVYDLGSKFGADEQTTVDLLKQIHALDYQAALTFHPGSQCLQENAYNSHIEVTARIEKTTGVELTMLNIGGGFPTAYPNSGAPTLENMFMQIETTFNQHFPNRELLLMCEPGRALADSAVTTVTRVKHRAMNPWYF